MQVGRYCREIVLVDSWQEWKFVKKKKENRVKKKRLSCKNENNGERRSTATGLVADNAARTNLLKSRGAI